MSDVTGFLSDPESYKRMGRAFLDAVNRGSIAGTLGAPVDLAALAMKPFGYNVEKPVGGSEWIGQKMQNAGMVSPERNAAAEVIAGLLSPALAKGGVKVAQGAESAIAKAIENASAPSTLNTPRFAGQRGALLIPSGEGVDNSQMAKKLLDYQRDHKPMKVDGGASLLHDLTTSFGEDIYGNNALQYFGSGDDRERAILKIMRSVRGKPDAKVTIYRGVPNGVSDINPGDWVTLDRSIASDYGDVISKQVPAKHITSWPDSLGEFGYYPD